MQAVRTRDVVLHAAEGGRADGAPIVFINSLGTDFRIWDEVARRLAPDHRLIRFDQRGHGLSGCPDGPYVIADLVADLFAVLDHFAVEEATLVGLSVGGMVALGAAQARPDRVRRLVLSDTAHRIGPRELWEQRIAAVNAGGVASIAEGVLERWFSAPFRSGRADELALWRALLTRTPAPGYAATCAAIRDADLTVAACSVAVPTLCLVGSEDKATPPVLVRELAGLIKGARLDVIEGSGHLPPIDNAQAFTRRLAAFLKEN
ncbi:3-oxoadipate enol-lactonase [Shumkonia mesophila]|uniref:3-oxoadipate enol-lactonase n=1 Tax=Shumkonia mesophila TaxID=2838854 RepID=UPI002934812A|nr:3-oxoadipate enol-lactonase [Shumkonia mesophila]